MDAYLFTSTVLPTFGAAAAFLFLALWYKNNWELDKPLQIFGGVLLAACIAYIVVTKSKGTKSKGDGDTMIRRGFSKEEKPKGSGAVKALARPPDDTWHWAGNLDRHAQREAEKAKVKYLGFNIGRDLAGWAAYYPDGRLKTRIGVVAVNPRFRRRGAFKKLLAKIVDTARSRGDQEVLTTADNADLRAYLSAQGFKTVDHRNYALYLDKRLQGTKGGQRIRVTRNRTVLT